VARAAFSASIRRAIAINLRQSRYSAGIVEADNIGVLRSIGSPRNAR
jgi:hypothetical protein